ncbi:MAG TPA: septum formation initiator family protein [Terriglobales bacterium]|nr:septum formation initiator family protein [Terriglobales bacterium]
MDLRAVIERMESGREWARKRQRKIASIAICAAAVLLAYHVFTGSNGIRVYTQKRAENRALQQELDQLKKENEDLTKRVKALKSDPETIEKEAREQLRYAKPGEVIYMMPEQKQVVPPNATAQQKQP